MVKNTDYAYIAGILDGEGTISISNSQYMTVRIRNTNKGVLEWIQGVTGAGKIYGDSRSKARRCYSLEMTANKAAAFLHLVLPYIRIKRKQAILALNYQCNGERVSGKRMTQQKQIKRQEDYLLMRKLNTELYVV